MNTLLKWLTVASALLACALNAAETQPSIYEKYPGFLELAERTGADLVITGETTRADEREEYFKEAPGIVDRYIAEGFRAKEVMDYILHYKGKDRGAPPAQVANITLRDFIRCFSRDLAYYDPVLPEEKKQLAAEAIITALQARSTYEKELLADDPITQNWPLSALGFYYMMSPWRHRQEVIDYVKSVYPGLYGQENKVYVDQVLALHAGLPGNLLLGLRPKPGYVFPVHPVAKARAEAAEAAAAQAKAEADARRPAQPAPEVVPAPRAAPSAPAPAPATPPPAESKSRSAWWLLALPAALAVVVVAVRKKKRSS